VTQTFVDEFRQYMTAHTYKTKSDTALVSHFPSSSIPLQ